MDTLDTSAEALFHASNRLIAQGDREGAVRLLREAIQLDPVLAEAHTNLAWLLDKAGQAVEAEAGYRRALRLAPDQYQTHLNFGAMLAAQKRFGEAESAYRSALALRPEAADAWSNLGALYASSRRETEAEQCYRTAIRLAPDYRFAYFNYAYLLLRQGRLEAGWRCLEFRDWYERLERHLGMPRWQGEPLEGKSFLIGIEAGHGDMIQFCRYAMALKARGAARVSVLCHPALKRLFQGYAGVDDAIALGELGDGRPWDYWSPPLSLPGLFGTTLDSIPAAPALRIDPASIARWAAAIGAGPGLRVGLVWKGNPRFENDADRSLPSLRTLAPLGSVPGVRFFSLQKGEGEGEAAEGQAPFRVRDLGGDLEDFADTAAVVANLDLVISVDTAVAHLAGTLGKRCWVLLPAYQTDWRWLEERPDTPWYPAMRLFRQGWGQAWDEVAAEVARELAAAAR